MSRYKLTPLEELRLEKKRLREERTIAGQRLSYQLQYLNDNWGSMLTKGVSSSIKTKITDRMDQISSGTAPSITPFVTKQTNRWFNNAAINILMANLPMIGSFVWRFAKPAIIAYGVKKGTALLFGKKSKKS